MKPSEVIILYTRQKGKCPYCKSDLLTEIRKNRQLNIDHITPKKNGGYNALNNLCITCRWCNAAKGTKSAREFKRCLKPFLAGKISKFELKNFDFAIDPIRRGKRFSRIVSFFHKRVGKTKAMPTAYELNLSGRLADMLDYLQENYQHGDIFSTKEVEELLGGYISNIRGYLRRLAGMGYVEKLSGGGGGRNNGIVWKFCMKGNLKNAQKAGQKGGNDDIHGSQCDDVAASRRTQGDASLS